MMHARLALLAPLTLALSVANAGERLDMTMSPRQHVVAPLRSSLPLEKRLSAGADAATMVSSFPGLDYRLNTAKYVGKPARIFYVVPAGIPALRSPQALLVTWKTTGKFQPGQARSGDRALVWHGTVRDAMMQETLDVEMRVDGNYLRGRLSFESYFEIEVTR